MSVERPTYLDSSAIVKLVVREPESAALRSHLRRRRPLISSALARTEVMRAMAPLGEAPMQRAHVILATIELIRVNDAVLQRAGALLPMDLRSLDAIHLVTAGLASDGGKVHIVTYDQRMSEAARAMGWTVVSPS
jgi:hypothetical protein